MSEVETTRPVTEPDSITEQWWEATKSKRLLLQRCKSCGRHQHYPRALCSECHRTDLEYVDASGRGEVYSFTVQHRAPEPVFELPYVVALVRLAEGPTLLTNIVGCPPDKVRCDMPVTVDWEALGDGRNLPVFAPAPPDRES